MYEDCGLFFNEEAVAVLLIGMDLAIKIDFGFRVCVTIFEEVWGGRSFSLVLLIDLLEFVVLIFCRLV